jgi:sodium transport system ATP-binding protein
MIEAQDLVKAFKTVKAVDGVSLACPDGQITGLLGPNGAGKTTTLRLLSTVMQPDSGTALIDGHDLRRDPQRVRATIGVLSDNPGLYGRLTPREHLRYFGRLHGLGGKALEARIDELVTMLEMREYADRQAEGFSRGMRQKVAIGRALVHSPRTVLFDEPTEGLDVMSTRTMRETMRRLRDEGRCVLLSSHLMGEVEQLCDRIAIISGGRLRAFGTPAELREQTGCRNLEDAFVQLVGADAEQGNGGVEERGGPC